MAEPRFVKKLGEQLSLLQSECESYDGGNILQAYVIATRLRVLLHDQGRSISMLAHCGIKNWPFLSTSVPVGGSTDALRFTSLTISLAPPSMILKPLLAASRFTTVRFEEWWEGERVFRHDEKEFSRKKLILSVAEKEGGAHVDAESEEFYAAIESGVKGYNMNLQSGIVQVENYPFSMIRQFGHEILQTANVMKWDHRLGISRHMAHGRRRER
jgi:hypothetical protein